jgi:hypothetical protein
MDQHRLEHIRFLTSRFHELQGLRVAVAGAALAAVMGAYLIAAPTPTDNGAMIATLASLVPMVPGEWWARRYYTKTFGQVASAPRDRRWPPVFFFVYFLIAWCLNTWIPSLPAGAPTAAIVALASLWVAIRDWPWRAYYLGATLAVAIGFAASASGAGLLGPGMTLVTIFLLLGTSLVPIGVLDHLQLVKLMREAREPEAATAASRPGRDA